MDVVILDLYRPVNVYLQDAKLASDKMLDGYTDSGTKENKIDFVMTGESFKQHISIQYVNLLCIFVCF